MPEKLCDCKQFKSVHPTAWHTHASDYAHEVDRVTSEINPLNAVTAKSIREDAFPGGSMEDHVGQRVAALKFEVNACDALQVEGLDDAAELLTGLREEYKALATVIRSWEQVVGGLMKNQKETVQGVGTLERHRDVSRSNWEHEDLLRVVLDAERRVKDEETGEIENDLDVLSDVFPMRGYNARVTALRARGIDPDEFCETEERGLKVRIT